MLRVLRTEHGLNIGYVDRGRGTSSTTAYADPHLLHFLSPTKLKALLNLYDIPSVRKQSRQQPAQFITHLILTTAGLGPGGARLPLARTSDRGRGVKSTRDMLGMKGVYVSE